MADIKGHQALDNYIPHKINMYLFLFSILLYISNYGEVWETTLTPVSLYYDFAPPFLSNKSNNILAFP